MKIKDYLNETRGEFKNITWSTRNQTIFYTAVVIVASAGIAYFLGLFDFLFTQGLSKLIS